MRILTFLFVGLLAAAHPLPAQKTVGKIAEAEGDVRATQLWDDAGSTVATGDPVRIRTRIETGRRSRARLLFDQGAVIEMPPRDQIEIHEEEPPAQTGSAVTRILQKIGTTRIFIAGAARDDFRVATRDANLGPKGTAFIVRVTRSRTLAWVLEGQVEVTSVAGGPPVLVEAGEMTVVRRGRQPTPPTPFDPHSGATGSRAVPPPFEEEPPDPPLFPVPEDLPPRRGIDEPVPRRGPP